MKALVWHGDRRLSIEELPDPVPREGYVELEVSVAGVCGSDLHGYRGDPGPRVPPLVLGHEAVGSAVGRPGRFVPFPLAICGACPACARGMEHLCAERGLLGLDRPGVFAERVLVPEQSLVPVPPRMPDAVAALTEPYAVALSVVSQTGVGPGDELLVIGTGPIGALTVHAAVQAGARVTAVDTIELRREVASRIGAHDVLATVDALPRGAFDVAVDSVGIEATWVAAISATRRGGSVTIVGLGAAEGRMPVGQLVREALTVRGHYAYSRAEFEQAIAALAAAPPDVTWISRLPLADGEAGFRGLVDHPERFAKILLDVGDAR